MTEQEISYLESMGFKPFREYMLDRIYEEMFGRLAIYTNTGDYYWCELHWKQGWGDNWYFLTECGMEIKPDEVKSYIFDFS